MILPFYRSVAFLSRDAMHKRGLCHRAVCVRLSVCHVRILRNYSSFFRTKLYANILTRHP